MRAFRGAAAVASVVLSSKRSIVQGLASNRVPRGMTALPLRSSEEVVEQLAESIVSMDLTTMQQFQRAALSRMMGSTAQLDDVLLQSLGAGGVAHAAAAPASAVGSKTPPSGDAADAKPDEAAPGKKVVEKLTFDVAVKAYPAENKVKLIKELRGVCNLSIADAKAAIEKSPGVVAKNIPKADAEKLKELFEKLKAEVTLS